MKGTHRIIVQNKRIRYDFTIKRNITVIRGDSATGKTALVDSIIFIDEGNEFVVSDDFASAIQDTDNYYVIVTREGIPSLPYSVDEIYGVRDSGKDGTLKRTYNEFYHLYQVPGWKQTVKPEKVVTEDSNSGFQFFRNICEILLICRRKFWTKSCWL